MENYSLYKRASIPDENFPIEILLQQTNKQEIAFNSHWHEQIELLYFTEGEAIVECNSIPFNVKAGDLVVINSNEIHSAQNISDSLTYYCIIIDASLFQSGFVDTCELKYVTPIKQNLILFCNKIRGDFNINECINKLINEFVIKDLGYELAIKSHIFWLLAILFRNHKEDILTQKKYEIRSKNLERFNKILIYIEDNYSEKFAVENLARNANMSTSNFCHLFKRMTGKTLIEYVNNLRINKAENLLRNTDMNISEVAMAVGFNDINYFSRSFKKYKKIAPTTIKNLPKNAIFQNTHQ